MRARLTKGRDVLPAVFGLIGVIVGAVLSGVVSYVLERQRADRAKRAAGRLVSDDLALIQARLEVARNRKTWSNLPRQQLPTAAWTEHRAFLAAEMEDAQWL